MSEIKHIRSPAKRWLPGVLVVVMLLATSCGSKAVEPFRDSGRGTTNNAPADVFTMPDGFSNGATKCDHGNRIYVVFKGDNAYAAIAVVPQDPSCKG